MLRVTVEDFFSGRPNPTWIVTNDEKIERLRGALVENPAAISAAGEGYQGPGYRGVQLHFLDDDNEYKLPPQLMIAKRRHASVKVAQGRGSRPPGRHDARLRKYRFPIMC